MVHCLAMSSPRLQQLLTFLERSPKEPFIRFAIAKEYEKLGDFDQALHYYQLTVADSPDYVGTYYHLGKLQEQLNTPAEAWATYSTGMTVARQAGDQHSLSELAGARLELGDEEDFE